MKSVYVELTIPVIDKSYDIELPETIYIYQAIELISKFFGSAINEPYTPSEDAVLCDLETGDILDMNRSLYELGIKNGHRLMII